ncbi:MAG: YicC family protein [Clostridiales bacterium]|nr:YicC family protein [Clostridiales bacterium]
MIKSMTGYGRSQGIVNGYDVTVEFKSVNHRYLEFSSRLPRCYSFLEDRLKKLVQARVARGKVEAYLYIENVQEQTADVSVNHSLAAGYIEAMQQLVERYGLRNDVTATAVARYPDVLTVHKSEEDEGLVWEAVEQVANEALDAFVAMRETEGVRMKADVESRADTILEAVGRIEERSPQLVEAYVQKLETRLKELLADTSIDEQRLLTEAAIFADKTAVAEETVRLRSHIDQLRTMIASEEAVGRKLDFLVQEINRETNTIGSKVQDVEIARMVVDMKAEIEKIREQIQNIE